MHDHDNDHDYDPDYDPDYDLDYDPDYDPDYDHDYDRDYDPGFDHILKPSFNPRVRKGKLLLTEMDMKLFIKFNMSVFFLFTITIISKH